MQLARTSPIKLQAGERHSPHLDALRIVASVAIVIMHYANYAKDYRFGKFAIDHLDHFNYFVDLFFVVSGFVIAGGYLKQVVDRRSVGQFLGRRFARIYPLHLVTFAFYLAIAIAIHLGLAHADNPARYPFSDIPLQLLLLHAIDGDRLTFNYPSWSLSAEMVCYFAFPLIALVALRRPALLIFLFITLVAGLTIFALFSGSAPWSEWINKGGAFRALPGFCLGVGLYVFRDRVGRLRISPALLSAALALFVFCGWGLSDLAAIGLVYLIAVFAVHCDQSNAQTLLTRLGLQRWAHLTYSSYMLHVPVATVVITMLGRFIAPQFGAWHLALILLAGVILAPASVASYRYFETPLRRTISEASDQYFFPYSRAAAVTVSSRAAR